MIRILFCIFFFLLFFITPTVSAITVRSGEIVTYSASEQSNGSLFISGSQLRIEGSVQGDLICVGQEVEITGSVRGDVICAGQTVRILGPVDGDIRIAGQMVSLGSSVAKNATLLGQTLYLEPQASISGEVVFLSQTFRTEGSVDSSLFGAAETVILSGLIGKDATLYTERVQITSAGKIKGNLRYTSKRNAEIATGSVISGTISRLEPRERAAGSSAVQFGNSQEGVRGLSFIVTSLVFGGLMLFLFKKQTEYMVVSMKKEAATSLLRGVLVFVGVPVVLVILILTLVGIPFAIIGILIFVVLYVIARSLTALALGDILLQRLWEEKKDSRVLGLGLGVLVLWSVSFIPVLGGIVSLLSVWYGLGGISLLFLNHRKKKKTDTQT